MSGTEIATDLLTPLGAYLRLREGARRRVPARVGRARPARPLQLRRRRLAARLASRRRRRSASRSSATSATTRSRASSRPCRCPTTGRACAESLFLVPDVLVRFDHARGVAELLRGDATRSPAPQPPLPRGTGAARAARARAVARRAPPPRRAREGAHPRGRRLPGRDRAARDAPDLGVGASSSTARCGASTRRRISSCSSSTTSRSSAARRRPSSSATAAAPS